jgi:hypothetical protein
MLMMKNDHTTQLGKKPHPELQCCNFDAIFNYDFRTRGINIKSEQIEYEK